MTVLRKWVLSLQSESKSILVNDEVKHPSGSMIVVKIRSSDPSMTFLDSLIVQPCESNWAATYWMNATNISPLVGQDTYLQMRLRVKGYNYRKIVTVARSKYYAYASSF
jgi:hypothetical protein